MKKTVVALIIALVAPWQVAQAAIPTDVPSLVKLVSELSRVIEILQYRQINTLSSNYRRGDQGEPIRNLQSLLNQTLGLNIPLTGYFGSITENAVNQFRNQAFRKFPAPTTLSPLTSQILSSYGLGTNDGSLVAATLPSYPLNPNNPYDADYDWWNSSPSLPTAPSLGVTPPPVPTPTTPLPDGGLAISQPQLGSDDTVTNGTLGITPPLSTGALPTDATCTAEGFIIQNKLLPDSRTTARTKPIDTIVIHDTDPGEGSDDAFTSNIKLSSSLAERVQMIYNSWLKTASAHYLIESGGLISVYRYVPDNRVASHVYGGNPTPVPPDTVARKNINTFSIGIELAYSGWWDKTNGLNKPNPQQYDALNKLIKCLKRKNPTVKQVILHCQASQNNGKEDPRNFDFAPLKQTLDSLGIKYENGGGNCRSS